MAAQIRSGLDFAERLFGFAVSTMFSFGAVVAIAAREKLDRLGVRRTATIAAAFALLARLSIAGLVGTWPMLRMALLVAGVRASAGRSR